MFTVFSKLINLLPVNKLLRNLYHYSTKFTYIIIILAYHIFKNLDGSTLLLRSSGHLGDHQPQLAGVYRMVDSYNDRPVYKQDMGENYIYYRSEDS